MVPVKTNQNWLPSIFNDFFDNEWMARANATAPAINVIENEKDYKVELAAPGMTKNDFKVSVDESNNWPPRVLARSHSSSPAATAAIRRRSSTVARWRWQPAPRSWP